MQTASAEKKSTDEAIGHPFLVGRSGFPPESHRPEATYAGLATAQGAKERTPPMMRMNGKLISEASRNKKRVGMRFGFSGQYEPEFSGYLGHGRIPVGPRQSRPGGEKCKGTIGADASGNERPLEKQMADKVQRILPGLFNCPHS